MHKAYVLYLPDVIDNLPRSEYDIYKYCPGSEFVSINKADKQKFIKEMTCIFRTKLKENLKLEYVCEGENCNSSHKHKNEISKCKVCGNEVCEDCMTDDQMCEMCESKIYPQIKT
jgi:hypothetical protein